MSNTKTKVIDKGEAVSEVISEESTPSSQSMTTLEIQDVSKIVPVKPNFVDGVRNVELEGQAKTIVDAVLANPSDATVTVQVYSLGSEFMNANTENISLMDTKISDVMREIEVGSGVNKSLTQIKTELDLVNPAVVAQTESSFPKKILFGAITRMINRLPKGNEILLLINERKDTVASTIDGLKRHLWEEKDKALRNAIELGQISNKLFETQKDLQEAVYVGQMVWRDLSTANSSETDPVREQSLRTLVNDLAVQVVDIQTVDSLNVQSRLGAETLISSARKIEKGVARVTNVLLPAVAVNLLVKAAASQQASLVGSMNDITRSAEETIRDTSKQTRQVAVEMEKMQSEGMINPEVLQACTEDVVAMISELEEIRNQTEQKARDTSKALNDVSNAMRKYADPMTNARHALEAVEANSFTEKGDTNGN